ncbi:hypothetical protein [Polyangium aurulentum]|uniref:hypothetical protein n=1 Tax=Polyangium aurulentum TaxID=2567896 RepID=UPI0010AE493A|nr:hypothetical protein [Polyangium aurulentum]UQA59703.1 hypothetical protein E8A73_004140 [Polyangium aurulentum]
MIARVFGGALLALFSAAALPGCASDAAHEPEPDLMTPGAFVAVEGYDEPGHLTVIRTLDKLQLENDVLLFVTVYDVRPSSWDEAREMAKSHEIPMRIEIQIDPIGTVTTKPHRVVWYRSLTQEEEDRVP